MAIGATLALGLFKGGGATGSGGGAILVGLSAFFGALAGRFVYRSIFDRETVNVVKTAEEIADEEETEKSADRE
jgi:hypothetical protein